MGNAGVAADDAHPGVVGLDAQLEPGATLWEHLRFPELERGLRAVIAIDDTTLGPGFGGVRYRAYPSTEAAAREAQRLAAAMTLKHALAELPYGGAKSVIVLDGPVPAPGAKARAR